MEFQKMPDGSDNPLDEARNDRKKAEQKKKSIQRDDFSAFKKPKREKTKRTPPEPLGPVARFFKWLFLFPLFLLTAAAIVLQFPWKVTAILFVFLTANTMLPRRAIKWFWLCVVGVVLAIAVWVMLPEPENQWQPYTFDEEIAAFNAKYRVPTDANAAVLYERLFEKYDANDFSLDIPSDLERALRESPWKSEHYPEIAEQIKQRQDVIYMLLEAGQYDSCYFPLDKATDVMDDERMQRVAKVRQLSRLGILTANNDIGERDIESAIEKLLAVLKVGEHFQQQPFIIDFLVGIAIEALGSNSINRIIVNQNLDDEALGQISRAMPVMENRWDSEFARMLDGERIGIKGMFGSFYDKNERGDIRLARSPASNIMDTYGIEKYDEVPEPAYWAVRAEKLGMFFAHLAFPASPDELSLMIDRAYGPLYMGRTFQPDAISFIREGLNFRTVINLLFSTLEPAVKRVESLNTRLVTDRRGTRLILALRRYKNEYGHWPESLDDIKDIAPSLAFVDAYNNEPFVYRTTEESFKLYSKGPSGRDDGGQRDRKTEAEPDTPDDWIIWPKD